MGGREQCGDSILLASLGSNEGVQTQGLTGFLGLSRDCVVGSRVLVLLPKSLCAGLLSTPCVGTLLSVSLCLSISPDGLFLLL